MDHRWNEDIRRAQAEREERDRYDVERIERDPDVERRDRLAERAARDRRPLNMSPWEIGAAHYDQRDLYTRNARIDDSGYGRGPSHHPEEGSYAYHRAEPAAHPDPMARAETRWPEEHGRRVYQREAWPWLNYEREAPNVESWEHEDRHARPGVNEENARNVDPSGNRESGFWHGLKERAIGAFSGSHRGRGPRGWQRSDGAIRDEVCGALCHHEQLDASDVEVFVHEAEVTLDGTVPDRASKRLAEDLADRCVGVREVHNRLRIRRDDDTDIPFVMPIRAF